jgi:nucleotide-binding universal stress UspA family protein
MIGFDGSTEGEDALVLGRLLSEALEAVPMVTTVVKHARHGSDEGRFEEAVSKFVEPFFSTARERLDGLEVVERPLIHDSRPRAIYELADWEKPELIVIGSTRRGPVGRVLLGTLGNSLLSGAPCGVAVAPRGYADRERGMTRIGVAVDGSSEGWRALSAGATLARRIGAPLRLLRVMEPPHYALEGLISRMSHEDYEAFKEKDAARVFEFAAERAPDASLENVLLHGDPADALSEAAEDLDLLIVGSRGYGPVKGTLLGSVSSKLMSAAPAPVIVVAREAGVNPFEH